MTLKRITQLLACLGLLLGAVHLGILIAAREGAPSLRLWFAGTGLAIVFAAVTNLMALAVQARVAAWVAAGTSLSMAALFAAALPTIDGPQALIGLVVFAGLSILSAARGIARPPASTEGA